MNRPLRHVAMACLLLFGLLILNVNWVQVVKADDYRDDPRNSRVLLRTYERERGPIAVLDADGKRTAVAESVRTDGPLEWLRTYPGGPEYAAVTGYYSLVYGRTGVERAQDEELSGDADEFFVRRLSDVVTGRSPQGGAVLLTLDPAAQSAAYQALQGNRGAVVALDPKTGAVLAMVSLPSYDPARLSSFEPEDIRSYYAELNGADADPLLNRAISKTYPPGSTFKVVTAAAALADGATPETRIPSPTVLDLPQTSAGLRNFGGSSCTGDTSTLADALRISCNTAFGALGLQLGDDKLREQAEKFGFGDTDLRVPTQVADSRFPEEANPPQTAQSAIGQFDVRVTPLQMAMVAAGVANDGEVMRPYLVKEVQAPDLSVVRSADPEVLSRAVSSDVAEQLTSMMQLVVEDGSGQRAQIEGVQVAGKTGTAQHAPGRPPHAWFIGFAPADDPQVAVAVVVEDGGSLGSEATGGALAAPIAASVMRAVLGPMTAAGTGLADALLAGRYRLLDRIAVGGQGEVWRAEDVLLSRPVAVKTLRSDSSSESDRARFRAEARHAARLAHPGIASVYDFGESEDRAWLVMELVDGEPLSHLLHREAPLSVDRTLDVVAQTADALHAAHQGGVVHRDVKPGNLLLRPDGVVKVTDFGIASAVDAPSLTQTGLVVGTAYYLSPEQAAGRTGSPSSDVYSLGVVAYECLTGERPFPGDNAVSIAVAHLHHPPPELPAQVPAGVRELVERALAKRPEDRFPDAAALAAAARALRADRSVPPPAAGAAAPGAAAGSATLRLAPVGDEPGGAPSSILSGERGLPGAERRSARTAVSSTLVLLLVLAAGAGVRSLLAGPEQTGADRSASPEAGTAGRTVRVSDLTGRSADSARAELTDLGLVVRLAYDGAGRPVGTVSGVDPAGDVPVGSLVVVHVVPTSAAVLPEPSAAGTTTAPAPSPAASSPAAAPPAAAPPAAGAPVVAPADAPAGRKATGKGSGKAAKDGKDSKAGGRSRGGG